MTDYAARVPLWLPHPSGGFANLRSLDGLGVSAQLETDLVGWQAYFERHFSPTHPTDWTPPQAAGEFARRGHELRDRLATALPGVTITLDLWPVAPTG